MNPEQPEMDADEAYERELAELRIRADLPDPWSVAAHRTRAKKAKKPWSRGYRRPPSRTSAGLRREAKDRRSVELRAQGLSYDKIATKLNLANKIVAFKMVQRGLRRYATASAAHYFRLELLRLEALRMECDRRIQTEDRPSSSLVMTALDVWKHRMALMGFWAAGELPNCDFVKLPTMQMDSLLDELDRLALSERWPEYAMGLEIHRVLKTLEAGHRVGGADQTAANIQQAIDDEGIAWQLEHAEDEEDLRDIEGWFNLTKKEMAEAADRHARRQTEGVTEAFRSREQSGLRQMELDDFARIMSGDTSRNWGRRVATYLRASRSRCQLLGLFYDPRRGPMAGSALPTSPDVEAELAATTAILVDWRKRVLMPANEPV
jgi:hypothetical protein